jgi:hypothetical protein
MQGHSGNVIDTKNIVHFTRNLKIGGKSPVGVGCTVTNIRISFHEQEDARRWKGFNELGQIDSSGSESQVPEIKRN